MNAVIENLLTRRSVRSFRDQAISEEDLQLILKTAAYAPSGMGKQTWKFTAVTDRAKIQKLAAAIARELKRGEEVRTVERQRKAGQHGDLPRCPARCNAQCLPCGGGANGPALLFQMFCEGAYFFMDSQLRPISSSLKIRASIRGRGSAIWGTNSI